jgi:acetoin utilization protein AcuB
MSANRIRRLPVVNADGQLVGMITRGDILAASPSITDQDNYAAILQKLAVLPTSEIMATNPLTVKADEPIERAALTMFREKIGGMPVVDTADKLVGIITETDIFRAFVEVMGLSEGGARLVYPINSVEDDVPRLLSRLGDQKLQIMSLVIYDDPSDRTRKAVVRARGIDAAELPAE